MSDRDRIIKLWAENKFVVMEHSQEGFIKSREYLKNSDLKFEEFEKLVNDILKQPINKADALKSVFQVWEMVKKHASEDEKEDMLQFIIDYKKNRVTLGKVKEKLHHLCKLYDVQQLLNSNYFKNSLI